MATRPLPLLLLAGTFALALTGCPSDDDDGDDGTPADAGITDLGDKDAGPGDAGHDAGRQDTGPVDTGFDAGPGGPQAMNFIHTNDEQSHLLGFAPNIDDYPTPSVDESIMGGIFRRARTIERLGEQIQTAREGVAVVNGGDVSMGSFFHLGNLVFGPDYVMLSQLGYDVGTLGNHEFDFGPDNLAAMIGNGHLTPPTTTSTVRFPLVVSNVRFSMSSPDDDRLERLWSESGAAGRPIQRYFIEEYGGVTVGFVGYMGLDAALVAPFKSPVSFSLAVDDQTSCNNDSQCPFSICIPPADDPTAGTGNCAVDASGADAATNFPALIADVASAVAEVRSQGVDLVVAVSHAGVNERELAMLEAMGLGPENATASEDILVALGVDEALRQADIPGIDVIIGGHSHTPLDAPIEVPNARSGITTFIVQAGANGSHVGRLRIERPNRISPWILDESVSGLTTIDGTVSTQGINPFTVMVLDGVMDFLIEFLEASPIATAGDGLIFPGEQCDGTTLPNNGNCVGIVPDADGGQLGCLANRQIDLSGCTFPAGTGTCQNDVREDIEQCDGTDLPMACADFGYTGGTIGCHANCTFDFSSCTPDFPSLLETALNFQHTGAPIADDDQTIGDLFFFVLGQATFDVGETTPYNESNLANLVADATRWAVNTLDDRAATAPVEIAIVANGVVRDGLYMGQTGDLSAADLFRVLPLGVSPQENTPGFTVTDFYLYAPEVRAALEVGLSVGFESDSFWLSISGARIEYDLSRPAFDPVDPMNTGRITKIDLLDPTAGDDPWADEAATLQATPLFDASLGAGAFPDPTRLVKVATSLYITLYAEAFGLCPRDNNGIQDVICNECTTDAECTVPGTVCDTGAELCTGGPPAAFFHRTLVPFGTQGFRQELKEVLGLNTYIRRMPNNGTVPTEYGDPVPRRMCCVGAMCPADGSRACN